MKILTDFALLTRAIYPFRKRVVAPNKQRTNLNICYPGQCGKSSLKKWLHHIHHIAHLMFKHTQNRHECLKLGLKYHLCPLPLHI